MRVLLCFLLINLTANAQHNFKGRVLDKNGLKIKGANIKENNDKIFNTFRFIVYSPNVWPR